jgi:hypothetical protein
MAPREGRPPSKDPKVYETRIRMSETEREKLRYCCEQTGKTQADIIRMGVSEIYEKLKK